MASKKEQSGQTRQHYDYARTGSVPGVGSIGGASLPKSQEHSRGGKVKKPHGRGR